MKLNAFSLTIFGFLMATLPATAQTAEQTDSFALDCPFIKAETEYLPDMNIPRAGHETFFVNGELKRYLYYYRCAQIGHTFLMLNLGTKHLFQSTNRSF